MAFTTDFSGDYEDQLQRYSTTQMQRAEDVANRPFVGYTGPRVAGLTALEKEGRGSAADIARSELGYDDVQAAIDAMRGVSQYEAGTYDANLLRDLDIAPYINQFTMGALDPTLRKIREQQDITLQDVAGKAAGAGAFGGSRQGVVEAETLKGYGQQMGDVVAQAQAAAFDRAMGYGSADIERLNQEQLLQEQMRQEAAGMQMAGASGTSQGVQQLRGISYQDADVLRQLGAEQRAIEQAKLDAAYNEFMREQGFPAQQLATSLAPLGLGTDVATAAPTIQQPTRFESLLGTIGAVGTVGNMFGTGYDALTGRSFGSDLVNLFR
jgi:hypothetical protein